jgi:hypothetical protein
MSKKILLFLNKTQEQRKDNTAYDLNSKTKIDIENQFKSWKESYIKRVMQRL